MPALTEAEARGRFYAVDRDGLLVEGMAGILDFQTPFVQARRAVAGWRAQHPDRIGLLDVVTNAKPTAADRRLGASAACSPRRSCAPWRRTSSGRSSSRCPIRPPRAKPTPQDLLAWTEGRAVIGTGSPFPPVNAQRQVLHRRPDQQRLCFPGRGARRAGGQGAARDRRHVRRRRQGARRYLAGHARSGSQPAPARRGASLRRRDDRRGGGETRRGAKACARPSTTRHCPRCIAAKMWEPVYRPYRRKVL